jgi:hypothetical protein
VNTQDASQNIPSGHAGSVADWLAGVRLGAPQVYRDIVVWPLFVGQAPPLAYRTLDEAVQARAAEVTEVSETGSVPQLKVTNSADDLLLILDGEELVGAKQNRVVNTTLLLQPRSTTVIPVSCTEKGRWNSTSDAFSTSDVVMEMKIRRAKMQSVTDSLQAGEGHSSDQGQVWRRIAALHDKAAFSSGTAAMHELFAAKSEETQAALNAFQPQPGQHGLLVALGGRVAGCDLLSRAEAYARLHPKLIRSYVLDAILEAPKEAAIGEGQALAFLASAAKCREERFPSVGCGESVRLHNGQTAGAALILEQVVIHVALFQVDLGEAAAEESPAMARLAKRSFWRRA